MRKAFEKRGFYGRWGGDEFLACVIGGKQAGEEALAAFRKETAEINERETDLPFGLSVAVGTAVSSDSAPLDPIEAVNLADEQMYEDKKRMKAERTA